MCQTPRKMAKIIYDGKYLFFPFPLKLFIFYNGLFVNVFTASLNNVGLEMMMNMFGGLGAGSLAVPNRSNGNCSLPFFLFFLIPFLNGYLVAYIWYFFCLSSQRHRKNSMPPSCHSFKKWVSLTHKRIYGH